MMRKRLVVYFVVLLLLVGFMQYNYDLRYNYWASKEVYVAFPTGKTMRILSFGYRNVLADFLFIWSIQFYGSLTISNRADYVWTIYDSITDLTPDYVDPYMVGSWIMALEYQQYQKAIDLLQKGSRSLKNEWIFDFESANYANLYLKNYSLAEQYYSKVMEHPNSPAMIKRLKAHMVYMRDDLNMAKQLWRDIYENAQNQMEKDSGFKHLYQIKFDEDKKFIKEKIEVYRLKFRQYPAELSQLKAIDPNIQIPRDMNGSDYLYNPQTGELTTRSKVVRWKEN